MPYKPTGRPAGRPRKDGLPPQPRQQETPRETEHFPNAPRNRPWDTRDMSKSGKLCEVCFPDGLGDRWHSVGCPHGVWFNAQ